MKVKKMMSAIALIYVSPISIATSFAADNLQLEEITVKANRFERKDTEATYVSEVHTEAQIKASGATTLYDFLAQQTSLNISANFGNKASPSVNLRGFGGENGYQNVVITVDGQRLNNVDMAPQLLAGIPLGNIERIEISKGSGSVIYGDGATAGAIQIYTKAKSGVSVSTSWGNYGQKNHVASAGIAEEKIDLFANIAHDSHDGFAKNDASGHHDQFTSNSQSAKLKIKPTDYLRFFVEGTHSRNDIRYVNTLTEAQFKDNPKIASGTYTHQSFNSDRWQAGAEFDITPAWRVAATHYREDKLSAFINFNSQSRYDYEGNEANIRYTGETFSAIAGVQIFDNVRKNSINDTSKDNRAYFMTAEYRPTWLTADLTLSAGVRSEKVRYEFKPDDGASLKESEQLSAWDVGANYRINQQLSIFANYNKAFQAPDIDRFFSTDFSTGDTSFNGFIKPLQSKTTNVGLNHVVANNRLKVSAFYAKLDNEIFYNSLTFVNTNFDESHKYGLEIQDTYSVNENLNASLIYNYTRAKIDKTGNGDSTYDDKELPGVPKHTVVANVNWKLNESASLNINHTWRSKAYAFNDLENNFSQKQDNYETTNLALNYQYKNINFFAAINNIFAHENSIQVADDAIYPVDFVRTWRVGMNADF
jgi:iron complex outermembrane receptor protein